MKRARGWLRRALEKVHDLLTETDTSLFEFVSSTGLVVMGLWLLWPFRPDTFETGAVGPVLAAVFPEPLWALIFIGFGILQSQANLHRNRDARRITAFASACVYGYLCAVAFFHEPASLFVPLFGVLSGVGAFATLHLRKRPNGERDSGNA